MGGSARRHSGYPLENCCGQPGAGGQPPPYVRGNKGSQEVSPKDPMPPRLTSQDKGSVGRGRERAEQWAFVIRKDVKGARSGLVWEMGAATCGFGLRQTSPRGVQDRHGASEKRAWTRRGRCGEHTFLILSTGWSVFCREWKQRKLFKHISASKGSIPLIQHYLQPPACLRSL